MSRKLRMDDRFEVFWKFRRKLRRLRISWLKYLISDVRSNYSFVLKINEEMWKRKVGKYSRENYPANVLTYREKLFRSIEALRSRLCARIDEFFTKPSASVLKRFYFIPLLRIFVIRHLHSALYPSDSFQIHSMGMGWISRYNIRIFAIYPYDIDDIPSIYRYLRI